MPTNHTAYKYEKPLKTPFVITQCLTNFTVDLQCGPTELGITFVVIIHINWILKLNILMQLICLMMSAYDRQIYTFVLNIK